jgi:hypothetical protein
MAWNDAELTPKGNVRLRYEALIDECRVSEKQKNCNSILCDK